MLPDAEFLEFDDLTMVRHIRQCQDYPLIGSCHNDRPSFVNSASDFPEIFNSLILNAIIMNASFSILSTTKIENRVINYIISTHKRYIYS